MGKDGSITLHKGATTVPEPIAAYLRQVEPKTRDALNVWLIERGAPVRFTAGAGRFELSWSEPPFSELEVGIELNFGSNRVLIALDGFAAIDPLLVGEPFAHVPSATRDLVLQRIVAHFLAALPSSLSDAADVRAIHWGAESLPRWDCAIGWMLRRPKGAVSRGMLSVESPETLTWLHANLPRSEKVSEKRVDIPVVLMLVLGRTNLDLRTLRDVAIGDVAWIESAGHTRGGVSVLLSAPRGGPQWTCRLKHTTLQVIEAASGDARRNAEIIGRARVIEPKTAGDYTMSRESGTLEIPITFDLGDVTVPLQSLEKIQGGYIFELPQDIAHASVKMRVAGTLIAEGQLIVIGKRLGVRVTKIHGERDAVA